MPGIDVARGRLRVGSRSPRLVGGLLLLPVLSLAGQAPGVPGPFPPVPSGYSIARFELAHTPRLVVDRRAWVPALHADVAVGNSRTRIGASLALYPGIDPAPSSVGGGVSLTQVLVDKESPARLIWLRGGFGVVRLDHEMLADATAYETVVGAGGAKRYAPPGIGEVLIVVAPRLIWRRVGAPPPEMDRDAGGAGLTAGLDWVSQARLGALAAVDLEWLSSRPAGLSDVQISVRLGASYRLRLFPRARRLPPPEGS